MGARWLSLTGLDPMISTWPSQCKCLHGWRATSVQMRVGPDLSRKLSWHIRRYLSSVQHSVAVDGISCCRVYVKLVCVYGQSICSTKVEHGKSLCPWIVEIQPL